MALWHLGESEQTRAYYDQSVELLEEKVAGDDDLRRFRDETAALMGIGNESEPDQATREE